jgi:hypothetical protein
MLLALLPGFGTLPFGTFPPRGVVLLWVKIPAEWRVFALYQPGKEELVDPFRNIIGIASIERGLYSFEVHHCILPMVQH